MPEAADAERVFRDMVGQGNKLIFGTTFGYMEPMLKVAADLKDVKFEHATGYKTGRQHAHLRHRTYEGAYMAGVIAGGMTKTNTLGVVGSIPIPEVIRNINSFTLGAQSVNPKVKTKVVWVNEWFDPPKETEAAQSLINGGADVLMQNTDSSAVLQTAEKAGKYAFGWDSDMTAYAPEGAPRLGDHQLGRRTTSRPSRTRSTARWKSGGSAWWGVKEGAIDIVSISDKVPADIKTKVEKVKAGLKDGSFVIWKGPIVEQRRQGSARRRTRSPTTSSWAASTSTSRASKARSRAARRSDRRRLERSTGAWPSCSRSDAMRLRRHPRAPARLLRRCPRPSCTSTSRARSSPS